MRRRIKLYEMFSIKPFYQYEEEETVDPNKYVIYSFSTDKHLYDVVFEKFGDGWQAEHKIGNPFTYNKYRLTNDNALRITSTVIHITQQFIQNKNPNFLIILYAATSGEVEDPTIANPDAEKTDGLPNKMSKRARLQTNYLKQIEGYSPKYYYRADVSNGKLQTCCLFYRNGYDISEIENDILTKYKFKFI